MIELGDLTVLVVIIVLLILMTEVS
jgi:hypothetical protein